MNREDIIRMACEAGFTIGPVTREIYSAPGGFYAELERFAALVADVEAKRIHDEGMVTVGHMREQIADERERADGERQNAMKIAAGLARIDEREACAKVADGYVGADPIAAAIRARGQA